LCFFSLQIQISTQFYGGKTIDILKSSHWLSVAIHVKRVDLFLILYLTGFANGRDNDGGYVFYRIFVGMWIIIGLVWMGSVLASLQTLLSHMRTKVIDTAESHEKTELKTTSQASYDSNGENKIGDKEENVETTVQE